MPLVRQPDTPSQFVAYIRTYLGEVDLENISRKYHNEVLYHMAQLFRRQRIMKQQHKAVYAP